jgi:uncharacterized protein (TIGR02001 family)
MNKVMRLLFGAALLGSAVSASAADIAGNVTLASDYRFRGISQLKGQFSPAIQGGFDFATDMGFYIGTWASNVNFTGGAIETDVYGGFRGKFDEDVAYDIGVLYYGYPHDNGGPGNNINLPYTEVYGSITFKGFKVGLNYSDDYFAESGKFYYPYIEYAFDPIENLTLSFHYAYNGFDEEQPGLDGEDYYQDWKIQASTKWLGVVWALAYVDTDLDDDQDCYGDKDLCAATAVLSISKSL